MRVPIRSSNRRREIRRVKLYQCQHLTLELTGELIGRYELLEQIGGGGGGHTLARSTTAR